MFSIGLTILLLAGLTRFPLDFEYPDTLLIISLALAPELNLRENRGVRVVRVKVQPARPVFLTDFLIVLPLLLHVLHRLRERIFELRFEELPRPVGAPGVAVDHFCDFVVLVLCVGVGASWES